MPDIKYIFTATGHDGVASAFKGIGKAAEDSRRTVERSFAGMGTSSAKAARGVGPEWGAANRRLTETQRLALQVAKDQERAAARAAQAAEKSAVSQARSAEKAAQAKTRADDRAWREAERSASRYEREEKQRQARITANAEKQAKTRARGEERLARERDRTFTRLGKDAALSVGGSLVAGGTAIVGSAVRDAMSLQGTVQRIAINARAAGEQAVDANVLRREILNAAAAAPGVRAADIAAGTQNFIAATGDIGAARRFQGTFATTASATGANVQDLASTGAYLMQKFNIKGVEEMQEAMAKLTFQGKSGAFELKDAAAEFATLAAAADTFGIGSGVDAVKTLGALAQVARQATGSASEATTAVETLFRQLTAHSKDLGKEGVEVFDTKTGAGRNVVDIITESIGKVKGTDFVAKKMALQKIFDVRGMRAIAPLMGIFQETVTGAKGKGKTDEQAVAEGMANVRAELERFRDAPGDWADVMQDASMAQQSVGARLTNVWETLVAKLGEDAVPAISAFIVKLTDSGGLESALDALAGSTLAVADVINAVYDSLPTFFKKEPDRAKKLEKAEEALAKFDNKAAKRIGPETPQEAAQREALVNAVKTAESGVGGVWAPGKEEFTKYTPATFLQAYLAAGEPGADVAAEKKKAKLMSSPTGALTLPEIVQRAYVEQTPGQAEVARRYTEQQAMDTIGDKAAASMDKAAASADQVAKAAATAAGELAKIKAPGASITGGAPIN